MKSNSSVANALLNDHVVKAIPELVVDWNMNRYIGAVASNNPSDLDVGFDPEIFPIESIVEANRPTKGINKARVGTSLVANDYLVAGNDKPHARYYIADVDDVYKYWTSPYPSNASTGVIDSCKPQVIYNQSVAVNKIVLTFENSWASPDTFSIQTTTSANPADSLSTGNWTEIANQSNVGGSSWKGNGQIVLYWNGTSWTVTGRSDNADGSPKTTTIRGVRIVVTKLENGFKVTPDGSAVVTNYLDYSAGFAQNFVTTGKDAHFDLIEISARLEVDLSDYVINVDDTAELSDVDQLYPIGVITSNQATVELSNLYKSGNEWIPGLFNSDNVSSPYHNYIDANAEMRLRYKYYDDAGVSLGTVQQFVMYTENWIGQKEETVKVDLSDYSKFLDDQNVPATMWEDLTVPEIVWRILDSVGFVNYSVDRDADKVTEHKIPVFYTDGSSTVWEVLDEIAKASQTAIYFDCNGVLQVKTRDFAFSPDNVSVWEFSSETVPGKIEDIISLTGESQFEPNHYKVTYQKTNWSEENRGQPAMQKVWEPEGTVVLRSTPLARNLLIGDTYFSMTANDVKVWPYEGMVNIEGELIKYKGKVFIYFTGSNANVANMKVLTSDDDFNSRNSQTPAEYRYKNYFTGAVQIVERGAWNSEERNHYIEANGYSVRSIVDGSHNPTASGFNFLRTQSKVRLNTPGNFNEYRDLLVATRGDTDDQPFFYYGTKLRFLSSAGQPYAGLVFHNSGANEDGYYIELTPSRYLNADERKNRNELLVYTRVGGSNTKIGDEMIPVGENLDYEIDVSYENVGGNHKIRVWINGRNVFTDTVAGSNRNAANGKFGIFARNKTTVDFEYLYAIRKQEKTPMDDFSFMDRVQRGYMGNQWDREWVFHWKSNSRRVKKETNDPRHRLNERFMDEFGPLVHEVREFDVKFDPAPVLHSRIYLTNDWSACCVEYNADPFGAKFVLANTYRNNAVVNGEDTLSFAGTGQSVNQILTVFGRALVVDESQEEIAKNDDQIRRRGKIESEISSPWIQSKGMAKDVVNWMNDNFSSGNDNITIEVFGNPLIEVADVVHVNYPEKHIDDDFFVIGVKTGFDQGITTSLTLRRRV